MSKEGQAMTIKERADTRVKTVVADADGHIMEPGDLWKENLEPQYRDKAMQVATGEDGLDYLEIAGSPSKVLNGALGALGTLDEAAAWRAKQNKPELLNWEDCRTPGAKDPHARIKWMDGQGIDMAFLYPSLGLNWQTECPDPDLANAYCQVYNDWITDFGRPYPDRLIPIAMISLAKVENGVEEIQRAVKRGAKGVYMFPNPPVNGIPYGETYYDPFWAVVEEMDIPIGIHVSSTPKFVGHDLYSASFTHNGWWYSLMQKLDCQLAFTTFLQGKVLDRFPRLKLGVVEAHCGWMPAWLDAMDAAMRDDPSAELLPTDYFQRQCWISGEPDEKAFAFTAQMIGADKLVWGSDYPHSEGHEEPLAELKETMSTLSEADQKKILGENAVRLYNLSS
jgi:predicted TIM-barrel fold metal-dependent hydrolase